MKGLFLDTHSFRGKYTLKNRKIISGPHPMLLQHQTCRGNCYLPGCFCGENNIIHKENLFHKPAVRAVEPPLSSMLSLQHV